MMFFLMCSERSGSNFITRLMNAHSQICGPATKHLINPLARNLFRYEPVQDPEHWRELLDDVHRLLNVDFSIWKTKFTRDVLDGLAEPGDVKSLIEGIYYTEAKAHGKDHVFIKENHLYEFMTFLLLRYPDAMFVYLVRDPRDMALSWKEHSAHPGGVVRAAKQWKKDQQNYLKLHNDLRKSGRSYPLRYEDLLEDPEHHLNRLLAWMGFAYEEQMLEFHQDELTQANAEVHPAWKNLSQGILNSNKGKYRNRLREKEIKTIEKICYYEMRLLGYDPEFTHKSLGKLKDAQIEALQREEAEHFERSIPDAVKQNMDAKKVFYRKEIDNA